MISRQILAYIIDENEYVITILSLENHPLIIPKKHVENIFDLDEQLGAQIMKESIKISVAVKNALKCDGVNIIQSNGSAAGQDVFHYHMHIKPRFIDDLVKISWNTAIVENDLREESLKLIVSNLK